MKNLYDVLVAFSIKKEEIHDILWPLSLRSGIDKESALILVLLSLNTTEEMFSEKLLSELLVKGLIVKENGSIKLTGKGSILAKSFCVALQKADC